MVGLGYRREMTDWDMPAIEADFFEVVSENWIRRERAPLHALIASGRWWTGCSSASLECLPGRSCLGLVCVR